MRFKYITYESMDLPTIIIFPETQDHYYIADRLGLIEEDEIIGAGFVQWEDCPNSSCYGESVGLKIKMHEGDTKLLRRYLKSW